MKLTFLTIYVYFYLARSKKTKVKYLTWYTYGFEISSARQSKLALNNEPQLWLSGIYINLDMSNHSNIHIQTVTYV